MLMIWLRVAAFAGAAAFAGLLWWGRREHRDAERKLQALYALPESEARRQALALLEQEGLFNCKPASGPLPKLALPPSVLEVLERFERIERQEFWVGRSALTEKGALAGYTKIGADFEFEEILVREGSTAIYLSYGPQHGEAPPETMPSLWHKLILAAGVPSSR
jgi:hypothetical protein